MKRLMILTLLIAASLLAACTTGADGIAEGENGGEAPIVSPGEDAGDEEMPAEEPTEMGSIAETVMMDRSTLRVPVQPPMAEQMQALIEGQLVIDEERCLRLRNEDYDDPGFLVVLPYGYEPRIGPADGINIVNAENDEVVATVDDMVEVSGGAIESEEAMSSWDSRIEGMPLENCSGPYWIVSEFVSATPSLP